MNAIPIPSFATTTTTKPPSDHPAQSSASCTTSGSSTRSRNDLVPIPSLVDQWLIRLEVALQIYFSQNKSSEIPYDKFCELVPKIDLDRERVVAVVEDSAVHNNNNNNDLLAEPSERLWHDFICVTEPVLYTWNEPSASLKRVIADGKRPHQLKRLLQAARANGISRAMSNRMVAFFQAMKNPATTTTTPSGNPQQQESELLHHTLLPTKSSPNKAITKVSSLKELEDRIRAKAHERQRHLDRAERVKPQTQQDELVTVADALVSHARQVLRQRQRGLGTNSRFRTMAQSKATKKKTLLDDDHPSTKCRISFQSLVEALPSYTRQQLSQTIERLAEQCPSWISWSVTGESSSDTSKDGGVIIIPKTAIIIMETANYKNTRAQLLGIHQFAQDKSPRRRLGSASAPERTPPHPTAIVPAVTVSGSKRSLSNSGMGAMKTGKRVREGL